MLVLEAEWTSQLGGGLFAFLEGATANVGGAPGAEYARDWVLDVGVVLLADRLHDLMVVLRPLRRGKGLRRLFDCLRAGGEAGRDEDSRTTFPVCTWAPVHYILDRDMLKLVFRQHLLDFHLDITQQELEVT